MNGIKVVARVLMGTMTCIGIKAYGDHKYYQGVVDENKRLEPQMKTDKEIIHKLIKKITKDES